MAKDTPDGLEDPQFMLGDTHRAEALIARGVDPYNEGELASSVFLLGIRDPSRPSADSSHAGVRFSGTPLTIIRLKQIIRAPFLPRGHGERTGPREYRQRLGRLREAGYDVPPYSDLPLSAVRALYGRIANEIARLS